MTAELFAILVCIPLPNTRHTGRRRVRKGDEGGRVDERAELPLVEGEEAVQDDGGAGTVADEDGGTFALDLLFEDLSKEDACLLCLVLQAKSE